nr:DsbA family protein [uncultured Gellertiella sp.]
MPTIDTHLTKRRLLAGFGLAASAAALSACGKSEEKKAEATPATPAQPAKAPDPATTASTAAPVEIPKPDGDVDMEKVLQPGALPEMSLGKADAKVTIVEYMSMTCPHCAHFHNETFEKIKEKYVDTGKVRFIIREFPFDPRAAAAFMLARCAPNGAYFPMVAMLFKQQSVWAAADDGKAALLQMSKLAGFTQESFEKCLTDQKLLNDVNSVRERGSKDFGVNATPTFLINGKRYAGAMSVETMSALIDSLL